MAGSVARTWWLLAGTDFHTGQRLRAGRASENCSSPPSSFAASVWQLQQLGTARTARGQRGYPAESVPRSGRSGGWQSRRRGTGGASGAQRSARRCCAPKPALSPCRGHHLNNCHLTSASECLPLPRPRAGMVPRPTGWLPEEPRCEEIWSVPASLRSQSPVIMGISLSSSSL